MQVIPLKTPPLAKAMNRVAQADRARSACDLETSIEHMRHAVRHEPMNASHHSMLGADLGKLGARERDVALMETGLSELHIAVQLDPESGNARNEIGIVPSNMRQHQRARPHSPTLNSITAATPANGWRAAYVNAIELSKDAR